ncbi:carcinoembryonic antigen-related cell adhesion molecule 1-like isoform X2 [Erinaceus europaeus]|uniref:Carcinoembryonic antigen-related cell adhesion molecule 1-like isoform X2 n=1 Tax=Erinaceus europaeus TaxID=9365 RepID=A0ABM3WZN6_ERIEU|nr:carcinoembryonic antigen-related cell adhesion molecule 1-like isoform X2 [Erinaceus europaeus]
MAAAPMTSVPNHRGWILWQKLLYAASLLAIWMSFSTAQITMEVVPPNPIEGMDVLLLVHNLTWGDSVKFWYVSESLKSVPQLVVFVNLKNKSYPGPAYNDRQTIYHNGSMLIRNINRKDTGFYSFQVLRNFSEEQQITMLVPVYYGPDTPTMSSSSSYYRSGTPIKLSCHATSNPPAQYSWWINGRPLGSTEELFIPSLSVNESGYYTCSAYNHVTGFYGYTIKTIKVFP